MMMHLQPPTSLSWARPVRDVVVCRFAFFGSSSARIEKLLTEMWMTVGAEGDTDTGMLFDASVESSCRIRPAYSTRRKAGDGGCAGEDHSEGHILQINSFTRPTVSSGSNENIWLWPEMMRARR